MLSVKYVRLPVELINNSKALEIFLSQVEITQGSKVVGLCDEVDFVYYPIKLLRERASFFSNFQSLSLIFKIPTTEAINTEKLSHSLKNDKDNLDQAKIIFDALGFTINTT